MSVQIKEIQRRNHKLKAIDLGDSDFRRDLKKNICYISKSDPPKCLQHHIVPILSNRFKKINDKVFNICLCLQTRYSEVEDNFKAEWTKSLYDMLNSGNYDIHDGKNKELAPLKFTINGKLFCMDIWKLSLSQIKRYCQPETVLHCVSVPVFSAHPICWRLTDKYYMEIKLSDAAQQSTQTDDNWNNVWCIYGIMEKKGELKPFLAVHKMKWIADGALSEHLKRIDFVLVCSSSIYIQSCICILVKYMLCIL